MKIRYLLVLAILIKIQLPVFAQEDASALEVGEIAPNFIGSDQNGNKIELYDILKESPAVVMFYRGFWCRYCNKQLSDMEDSLRFINEKGGVVIAITPEQPQSIKSTMRKTNASFKIIHDKKLEIMKSYNVSYSLDESMINEYRRFGIDILSANADNGANLPVPATYIIGQNKKILFAFFDPDYKKRATVFKILQNL